LHGKKKHEQYAKDSKERNHLSTIPGKLSAAVLQSKQEADHSRQEKQEPKRV
jgi:hypothetical protein